jgi:hypothetical protein
MKVALTVSDNMIDKRLVVVFDETGINLCPTAKTTFNIKGEKQVILSMLGDKRQYTLGLGMLLFIYLFIYFIIIIVLIYYYLLLFINLVIRLLI